MPFKGSMPDPNTTAAEDKSAKNEIGRLKTRLRETERRLALNEVELRRRKAYIRKLTWWLEQLDKDVQALLNSKRWLVGDRLLRGLEILLRRPRVQLASDHMRMLLKAFRKERSLRHQAVVDEVLKRDSSFHRSVNDLRKQVDDSYFDYLLAESEHGLASAQAAPADHQPLVSVIMPTYNRGFIIEEAIASVCAQSYQHWELLICDDGSTDDTAQRIAKLEDSRVHLLRLSHAGGCRRT